MMSFDELWKEELQKYLHELKRHAASVGDAFQIDKALMFSAFITRKLFEDTAVTDRLRSGFVEVTEHESSRNGEDFFYELTQGPLNVKAHFDMSSGMKKRISYFDLASEIIHCDGLIWFGEDRREGFLAFSYRNALKRLLAVPIEQYVGMAERIAADRPQNWFVTKDLNTGKISRHAE